MESLSIWADCGNAVQEEKSMDAWFGVQLYFPARSGLVGWLEYVVVTSAL